MPEGASHAEIFLGLKSNFGLSISPFPFQKLPKIVNNNLNSLALHFGENFMKIGPTKAKLWVFTVPHSCNIFNMNAITMIFTMVYNQSEMEITFLKTESSLPILTA